MSLQCILLMVEINHILREKKPGFSFFAAWHERTNIGLGIRPDESLIISSNQGSDRQSSSINNSYYRETLPRLAFPSPTVISDCLSTYLKTSDCRPISGNLGREMDFLWLLLLWSLLWVAGCDSSFC